MLTSLVITLREGLEAALVVGIVLSALRQLGQTQRSKAVWAGVFTALVVSLVAGVALSALGTAFEGRGEQIFEGLTMLLAAIILTWMIFWMQSQGRQVQARLKQDTQQALTGNNARLLFGLSFVAVVREGLETALFLAASTFGAAPLQTLVGGLLGLLGAVTLGWVIYAAGKRLNLRLFFRVTGVLLILFAAGLLLQSTHEFQEAGLLPGIIERVWDTSSILSETGVLGSLARSLLGYSASPSLLQVIIYVGYLVVIGIITLSRRRLGTAA